MGNISRRDFVRLTMGALGLLPRVTGMSGAFLLADAPSVALAQQEGPDPTHIILIDPDELGVQVLDVASGLALGGARITITSYAEGATTQTVEGTCDASGVWSGRVAELCGPRGWPGTTRSSSSTHASRSRGTGTVPSPPSSCAWSRAGDLR